MTRFESLRYAPAETRKVLRERFARNLLSYCPPQTPTTAERVFDDEAVLKLFQRLAVVSNDLPARARELYNNEREGGQNAPTVEELITQGWITAGWQRMSVSFDVARTAGTNSTGELAPFIAWLGVRHDSSYQLRSPDNDNTDAQLSELAEAVMTGALRPTDIACASPNWVAARAWDRDERHHTGAADFLFGWLQVWEMLKCPELVPSRVWGEDARKHFISAALAVLENDARFTSWDEYRRQCVLRLARAHGAEDEHFASYLPDVPSTLVGRAAWLGSNRIERLRYDDQQAWAYAAGLIRLLLADVEHSENSPAPHPLASKILELAGKHPEVLSTVLFGVGNRPELVVELLLKPETSALACLVVSQWSLNSGAWDRALTMRDNEAARYSAFVDAVSVMSHYVKAGQLAPAEVAALLYQMQASVRHDSAEETSTGNGMLAALRGELANLPRNALVLIFEALMGEDYEIGLGLPTFSAALDIVDVGQLGMDVEAAPLVQAYIRSIRSRDYHFSAARISPDGAATLFAMSQRLDSTEQQDFLAPLDVKARLATISTDDNPYTVKNQLAHALRAHIRVLSRAIIGQRGDIPKALIDALGASVYSGALAHDEKGRVAAFAARYERSPSGVAHEQGLAFDLGRALELLVEGDAERLLKEILQTDEPAFLAQLLGRAPRGMRKSLEERIKELVPEKAGDVLFFTDIHHRIDELLAAGAYAAAAAYIASEPEPPTPLAAQFALIHLRQRLRLAVATQDWATLENIAVPPEATQANAGAAQDIIDFHRAVAQFTREDGDISLAEQLFASLHQRHPHVSEYGFNLFATRLARLVARNPFVQLQGADLAQAKQLLAEALEMERAYGLRHPTADSYLTNKALLLLAVGRPSQADEILRPMFLERMTDSVAAYSAVALARVGRTDDGIAALGRAEETLGPSEVVRMTRAYLIQGQSASMPLQVVNLDSSVANIKQALWSMHQMDPVQQAELWSAPPTAFVTFVTDQVRRVAASIVGLVPMMKEMKLDSCEDDVNAVVRQLLASRLAFLNWEVSDQSKGGYTAKGNPGERDVVIHKDSCELAVIEAVVCTRPANTQWTNKDLTNHFQKLLGYSTCKLFFHLTYSRLSDISSIVALLKKIAIDAAPPHFDHQGTEDLQPTDSRPTGFLAQYRTRDGDITVVFLVLNLGQDDPREAAKLAASNSARSTRKRGARTAGKAGGRRRVSEKNA